MMHGLKAENVSATRAFETSWTAGCLAIKAFGELKIAGQDKRPAIFSKAAVIASRAVRGVAISVQIDLFGRLLRRFISSQRPFFDIGRYAKRIKPRK
jgi:hypothetical protein